MSQNINRKLFICSDIPNNLVVNVILLFLIMIFVLNDELYIYIFIYLYIYIFIYLYIYIFIYLYIYIFIYL
jgi:hypothetical protein